MDVLEADDREQARGLSPAEKLRQALEMMRSGIRLKRARLRQRFPNASEGEIDQYLTEWLAQQG